MTNRMRRMTTQRNERIALVADTHSRSLGQSVVVFRRDWDSPLTLGGMAWAVWVGLSAAPATIGELIDDLVTVLDQPATTIAPQVRQAVDRLLDLGIAKTLEDDDRAPED